MSLYEDVPLTDLDKKAREVFDDHVVVKSLAQQAALHGERLAVAVTDDGEGLDIAGIRERLAASGRTVPDADADVARTLFEPGFSMRSVATNISPISRRRRVIT